MGDAQSHPQEEPEPEPGDLIEIIQGLYKHWAVAVGGGDVVHLTVPDGASGSSCRCTNTKKGLVKKEPLSKAVGDKKYYINNKYDEKYDHRSVEKIIRDAEERVGDELDYNLLTNNCEHFVTGLRNGTQKSGQVEDAFAAGLGVVVGGALVLGAGTLIYSAVKGRNERKLERQ